MLTGWASIQARLNETREASKHALGLLSHHLSQCEECAAGSLCKWAEMLSRPAGKSVYVLPCPCGTEVRSHHRETICPSCHRQLTIGEWGGHGAEKGAAL